MITVNKREIPYKIGMTVEDAIRAAGESFDSMTLVVVDGVLIPCGRPHKDPLDDGSYIKLLPILSGG